MPDVAAEEAPEVSTRWEEGLQVKMKAGAGERIDRETLVERLTADAESLNTEGWNAETHQGALSCSLNAEECCRSALTREC